MKVEVEVEVEVRCGGGRGKGGGEDNGDGLGVSEVGSEALLDERLQVGLRDLRFIYMHELRGWQGSKREVRRYRQRGPKRSRQALDSSRCCIASKANTI